MNGRIKQTTKQTSTPRLSAEQKYYILQKTVGIFSIIFGVISSILMEEATPLIIFLALGAAFLFSKEKILMATNTYWEENPVNRKNYPKI